MDKMEWVSDEIKARSILLGYESGDYLNFACAKCGCKAMLEYVGKDPSVPVFLFSCATCGEDGQFKIDRQFLRGVP